MKFLLENNLSKLAKWLRFLGHDVRVLEGEINLRELALNQDRIFITTSKRWKQTLEKSDVRYLVVPRHNWELQLCMVIKHFNIKPELRLDKCAYCGEKLVPMKKEEVKDRVPPKAYGTAYDFTLCQRCNALFWKGTHYEGMLSMLERVLRRC